MLDDELPSPSQPRYPAIRVATALNRFMGSADRPMQVIHVEVEGLQTDSFELRVRGRAVRGCTDHREVTPVGQVRCFEIGVELGTAPGDIARATVELDDGHVRKACPLAIITAEPGWTGWLVPHFHFDPVFWATQATYVSEWSRSAESHEQTRNHAEKGLPAFDLIRLHIARAERDPDYRFVLAEIDYLQPFWDSFPEFRTTLRELIAEGRLEIAGGSYNEPSTTLISAEATLRNFALGMAWQQDVLGIAPSTGWQLDVFGHDPSYPALAASVGITRVAFARGPHHEWGAGMRTWTDQLGDLGAMQMRSEFSWLAPSGQSVTAHFLPANYAPGWWMHRAATIGEAESHVERLMANLEQVAASHNVLIPVGSDYSPPNRWVTELTKSWDDRYVWPKLRVALPEEFFDAVQAEKILHSSQLMPQSRDMNPVFAGTNTTYSDTKLAHRACETALIDAEKFATIASVLGAQFPERELDRAWRQIAYASHHDAVTGSESDQVYLDLLTVWRGCYEIACDVRNEALAYLGDQTSPPAVDEDADALGTLTVFNSLSWRRADIAAGTIEMPPSVAQTIRIVDASGDSVPALTRVLSRHPDGSPQSVELQFRADDIPATGYRNFAILPGKGASSDGWTDVAFASIQNEFFRLSLDQDSGGVTSCVHLPSGRELVEHDSVLGRLGVYEEYPEHPRFGEGPWQILLSGAVQRSGAANVIEWKCQSSVLGQRIILRLQTGPLRSRQTFTLWNGVDRVDVTTEIEDFTGENQLVRLEFPTSIRGLPVAEAALGSGIAKTPGVLEADIAVHRRTLDNTTHNWIALGSPLKIRVRDRRGDERGSFAVGVAEIIVERDVLASVSEAALVAALAGIGVSATLTRPEDARYGDLEYDSNLPNVRIVVGTTSGNEYVERLLGEISAADEHPFDEPQPIVFRPPTGALDNPTDVTDLDSLPTLFVVGTTPVGIERAIDDLIGAIAQRAVDVTVSDFHASRGGRLGSADDFTFGVLNSGTPGFVGTEDGVLAINLLRSSTGAPSAGWTDGPRRTSPDGSGFQLQHWTNAYTHSLVAGDGDWRRLALTRRGREHNHPLEIRRSACSAKTLPPELSFIRSTPESSEVMIEAIKPIRSANTIENLEGTASEGAAIAVRLSSHSPATERLTLALFDGVQSVDVIDAAERTVLAPLFSASEPVQEFQIDVPAHRVVTLATSLRSAGSRPTQRPGPWSEARYWLHNVGGSPNAFGAPTAMFRDRSLTAVPGGAVDIGVTVAAGTNRANGIVALSVPPGWESSWNPLTVSLPADASSAHPAVVGIPAHCVPGTYVIESQAIFDDGSRVRDTTVIVVQPNASTPLGDSTPIDLAVAASARANTIAEVSIHNNWQSSITAVIDIVTPFRSWANVRDPRCEVVLHANETLRLEIPGASPAGGVGHSWLMARAASVGQVFYSRAVRFELG
jgi:alpha-mannosidase